MRQQLGPQSHHLADERARLVQLTDCMEQVEKTIMKLQMAEQAEPLWPSRAWAPINIDRTLAEPYQEGDEFIYWGN